MTYGEPGDYMVNFEMDGQSYGFVMPAMSAADADKRLRALKMTGRIMGGPCISLRTNALTLPFVAVWARVFTWWKNLGAPR